MSIPDIDLKKDGPWEIKQQLTYNILKEHLPEGHEPFDTSACFGYNLKIYGFGHPCVPKTVPKAVEKIKNILDIIEERLVLLGWCIERTETTFKGWPNATCRTKSV